MDYIVYIHNIILYIMQQTFKSNTFIFCLFQCLDMYLYVYDNIQPLSHLWLIIDVLYSFLINRIQHRMVSSALYW